MTAFKYIQDGLDLFDEYSQEHDRKYISKDRLPKNWVWRPYRFAVNDVIIGLVVVQHDRNNNCLAVDVCLTDNNPALVPHTGARVVVGFLLSEAFKCGGSMEIRFTKEVEEGRVPEDIVALALHHNVKLAYVDQGRIAASEAIALYMEITKFSEEAKAKIADLVSQGALAYERTCYMVHHGVWSDQEMDQIVLGSRRPDSIIHGSFYNIEQNYLLYMNDIYHARGAILGGMLDTKLKYRERIQEDAVYDLESDDRSLSVKFDPILYAKRYTSNEDIPVPWIAEGCTQQSTVPVGTEMVVFIRQRLGHEIQEYLLNDLHLIKEMIEQTYSSNSCLYYMLVPYDFVAVLHEQMVTIIELANSIGVGIIIMATRASQLDAEVFKKFKVSRSLRAKRGGGKPVLSMTSEVTLRAYSKEATESIQYLTELKGIAERIASGVGIEREKSRFYLVSTRLEEALLCLNPVAELKLSPMYVDLLDIIADTSGESVPVGLHIYSPEQVAEQAKAFHSVIPEKLTRATDIANRMTFYDDAAGKGCYVLEVQNHFAPKKERPAKTLTKPRTFLRREKGEEVFVDNSRRRSEDVFTEVVSRALAARPGEPSEIINFSNPSHITITEVLNRFVYTTAPIETKYVRVTYLDGSEARPFPLHSLRLRNAEEVRELRSSGEPLRSGLVSMRHQDMDRIISEYWFRNVDVSSGNVPFSEIDEFCYQHTRERLARIRKDRTFLRVYLYHTGLEQAIIGFYRAVVDDSREHADEPPFIEITPHYYPTKNGYRQGALWY